MEYCLILITLFLFLFVILLIINCKDSFTNTQYFYIPDDSLYVIYSAGNSGYQEWQTDLLDFSFKKSNQPGTLIRIVSDDNKENRKINNSKVGYTLITPDFSKLPKNLIYPPLNKSGSMKFFMDSLSPEFKKRNKDSTLLFLDPDMIFTKPWDPRNKFKQGEVYGQKWKGYSNKYCTDTSVNVQYCPKSENTGTISIGGPIMFPFAIKLGDFDSICDDIYNFAKAGYLKHNEWMAEMSAFATAIEKAGYKNIQIDNLGLCNNWDNKNDPEAPIMHFCQAIKNKEGKEIWGKHRYQKNYNNGQKWDPVPDPSLATNRVDKEVLTILHQIKNIVI